MAQKMRPEIEIQIRPHSRPVSIKPNSHISIQQQIQDQFMIEIIEEEDLPKEELAAAEERKEDSNWFSRFTNSVAKFCTTDKRV
jgi:hypothetical protein